MAKSRFIKLLGLACLLGAMLILGAWDAKDTTFKPSNADMFVSEMQKVVNQMHALQSNGATPQEIHTNVVKYHRAMTQSFPIYYDWWLQDGPEDVHAWMLQSKLSVSLSARLEKHSLDAAKDSPEGIKSGFKAYLKACEKRREERLKEFTKDNPEIVFTKLRVLRPSFFAYTVGLSDARHEYNFFPGGSLNRIKMKGIWAEEECLLSDEDGGFRDPNVHFDGEHLLFAWKKSPKEDDYHLYEMNLKTKKVKQITEGLGNADFEGIYLPDDNILFNSTRGGGSSDCYYTEVTNLFICDREGRFMRQVGFDQVHTCTPTLLDDGRVVYTRWDYSDRGQIWTQPLFQMNPDGTGQAEYYGMNSWFPTTVVHTRRIPGTRKVMATFNGHHTPQHGKLGIIDPEAGRDENEGVMFVAPYHKPEAVRVDQFGMHSDQFQYPYPMNEQEFLISYTPLGYHIGHPMVFGIYWMNIDGERELLVSDPNISCNHPVLIAPRKRPFQKASTVDYTKQDGVYYMQNIYEGEAMKGVKPGTIKQLRIVEIEFRVATVGKVGGTGKGGGAMIGTPPGVGRTAWDLKKVWGVVDVHPDGSAFFRVPARKPLYFQALDENGRMVQTMRSWSTLMPNETQSCVGCHEHKNTVPVANMGTSMAMKAGIQDIKPEDELGVRTVSFQKEIQPILDKHCISCHDGKKHAMSLTGELKKVDNFSLRKYSDAYINLTHTPRGINPNRELTANPMHPEVNWIDGMSEPTLIPPYTAGSNKSNIIKRMENGHGGAKLTPAEIRRFSMWIDLCVPFVGDYREANDWSEKDHAYYDYYDKKREANRAADKENIRQYVEYLKTQK